MVDLVVHRNWKEKTVHLKLDKLNCKSKSPCGTKVVISLTHCAVTNFGCAELIELLFYMFL